MASRSDNPKQNKPKSGPRRGDGEIGGGEADGADGAPAPRKAGGGRKVRIDLRRNRLRPKRQKDWTDQARESEGMEVESPTSESISPKGAMSRKRTVVVNDAGDRVTEGANALIAGVVLAVRGQIIEVDDGTRVWRCVMRRMLRTQLIRERNPVTTGDRASFRFESDAAGVDHEGVIERIEPRKSRLSRIVRGRVHDIVANVDQALIVSSAGIPQPKPHLIDRYLLSAHDGGLVPIVCMNKIDLDEDGSARDILVRYAAMGYRTLSTSAATGEGVDELRELFRDKSTVVAGQSGVGKSSLLNLVQPGLGLKVGTVIQQTFKGRHTTTTAVLYRLDGGGYFVDTPGVKSLDITCVPLPDVEKHFVDIAPFVSGCKFSDCTHRHEGDCAVIAAVESGAIHEERYESYLRIFEELQGLFDWKSRPRGR
jgi:ribosome biogenesis GTPase